MAEVMGLLAIGFVFGWFVAAFMTWPHYGARRNGPPDLRESREAPDRKRADEARYG